MAEFSSLASILNWEEDILIIDWKDADKYYGQYVIVEGTIVDTYNSGKAYFLNFDPDWQQYFTAVIFACDFPSFPESPENYYLDKKVNTIQQSMEILWSGKIGEMITGISIVMTFLLLIEMVMDIQY